MADPRRELGRLTETEQANVLRALVVLRYRLGEWRAVAQALSVDRRTMMRARAGTARVTACFALRVARALGEPLGNVITGRLPAPGSCQTCGRCDP